MKFDVGDTVGFLGGFGRPEMIGGGRVSPSAAFRESCRAKSEACHHSRNLRAKMAVGRRIRRIENRWGRIVGANVRGLNPDVGRPGRDLGDAAAGCGPCSARAIAL